MRQVHVSDMDENTQKMHKILQALIKHCRPDAVHHRLDPSTMKAVRNYGATEKMSRVGDGARPGLACVRGTNRQIVSLQGVLEVRAAHVCVQV